MSSKPSSLIRVSSSHFSSSSFRLTILHQKTKNTLAKILAKKSNIFLANKLKYLNIAEVSTISFFILTKNENNKLFSLTLNKIIF